MLYYVSPYYAILFYKIAFIVKMQKFNVIPASCLYLVASILRPISRLSPCSSSRETLHLMGLTGRGAFSSSGAGNSSTNLPRKPLHSSSIMFQKWQIQHAQVQLVSIFHSDTIACKQLKKKRFKKNPQTMHLDQSKNQESNHEIQFHVAFVCQILIIKCPPEMICY